MRTKESELSRSIRTERTENRNCNAYRFIKINASGLIVYTIVYPLGLVSQSFACTRRVIQRIQLPKLKHQIPAFDAENSILIDNFLREGNALTNLAADDSINGFIVPTERLDRC